LLFERSLSAAFSAGLFAGTQPEWQYAEFQTSIQKYGAYANFIKGDRNRLKLETSLALVGEYHSSTVSREFIYMRNYLNFGRRLSVYQNANIDINRRWRKERTDNSLSLSNVYLSVRYKTTDWLSTNLSYDSRTNYLTYDTRTIDERIFDDNTRRGYRAGVYLNPLHSFSLNGSIGYRKREGDDEPTYSYSGGIRQSNITSLRIFFAANITSFNSEFTNGINFSTRIGKYFKRGDQVTLKYGLYSYDYEFSSIDRKSPWFGTDINIMLLGNIYLYTDYQYNYGDDLDGHKVLTEIGYRF
jgi:hypothetical protein